VEIATVIGGTATHDSRSPRVLETDELPDLLFPGTGESSRFASKEFRRTALDFTVSSSRISDSHAQYGARVCYLRAISRGDRKSITFSSKGLVTRCISSADFGSLLSMTHEATEYTLWLPCFQQPFRFDSRGRIEVAAGSYFSCEWAFVPRIELKILPSGNSGEIAVIPCMVLTDPGGVFFHELSSLNDPERRLYRKSDWFYASRPLDIWKYLINGSVYDPRSIKGIDKRFKCQQCAFAWWNYFSFLRQTTGKKIYGLLQDEVACSILLDLSAEGEWGHGYWSDEIETHARFHLDGIHLLISQYEKTDNLVWLEAAERGMGFIFNHLTDRFDDGSPWFLHDTLENKTKKHRFRSTLFGKSPGNSLCINTHVQALTVLYRLGQIAPNPTVYTEHFAKGLAALRRVLDHQPGEFFYRVLAKGLATYYRHAAPSANSKTRIKNAAKRQALVSLYRRLKRFFPRLVLPGGFIDRDLTLSVASDHYHNINVKDLLTLYQQTPDPWLRDYIKNAFGFSSRLVRTWGLDKAVLRSPYYFEFMDILHLYDRLIEPLPPQEIARIEETLQRGSGGYSLDYYASELVRGDALTRPSERRLDRP
jgi:hypothetical protein